MGKFLSLEENVRFVRGPINGAIYDLNKESVQPVPETMADVLEACFLERTALDAAIERVLSDMNAAGKARMREIITEHPLLRLGETPQPYQPIQPSMNEQPEGMWLELTAQCNLRCRHCYASSGPEAVSTDSLPLEKWKDIIREGAEIGFAMIQFTGGEPLLYPNLIDLIHTARQSNYLLIEVYSNLTLLSDELVNEFKCSGVSVATSFYSYDRKTHNEITQNESSYDRTLSGIRKIIAAEIPIRVGVILMEQNLSHGERTQEFLKGLGIPEDKIGFDYVRCSGRGSNTSHAGSMKRNGFPMSLKKDEQNKIIWNSCWPGKVAIRSDGSLSPCVFVREAIDTVKGKQLKDSVPGENLKRYWAINLGQVEVCKDCEFRYGCMDCRANALNATGDLYARNPSCGYNPYAGVWDGDVEQYAGYTDVKPRQKSDVNFERFDDRSVVHDSDGNLSILNSTAVMVWELCDGEHSVAEITDEFLSAYEADRELVYSDVKRIVGQLTMRGLLEN